MDVLPPGWEDLSARGLLGLVVLLVLLGWLIPKRLQDKRDAEKDATIDFQRRTIESLTGSVQKQTVNGDLTVSLLRSIDRTANEKGGGE